MLHLRVFVPVALADQVVDLLSANPAVSCVARIPGASLKPAGDVVEADVAREAATGLVDQLRALNVHREGTIHLEAVDTWISQAAHDAERSAPGSPTDSVVWADVVQRSQDESQVNAVFLVFMSMAALIAGIAIVLDSQILVIGSMILGPEFGAIAALAVALVRRRVGLFRQATVALVMGFSVAIGVALLAGLVWRALGWVDRATVSGPRPATGFIYEPDKWSLIVAVIAAVTGVLTLTSTKAGPLAGVLISVTTIPAAANIGLSMAVGAWHELGGSFAQLGINLAGMAVAGWLTLALQQALWSRVLRRTAHGVQTVKAS